MLEEAKAQAGREPKHVELDEAINRLDGVLACSRRLMARIEDGGSDQDGTIETPPHSLYQVLDGGSERIREKSEQILNVLNNIETALF